MLRDVSERVRLEAASRRSESLRVLLEELPDAVMVHRAQRLLYVNRRFLEPLGFDRADDVVGRSIRELVHPDDWQSVEARLLQLEATGKPVDRAEERFRGREGREVRWEVAKVPIVFDGRPAVVALGRDVSARHRSEELLHLADRLATVGTLAAGVAHGINNPLSYVKGNLVFAGSEIEELERECPEAALGGRLAEIRRALDQATEGANRIRDIVADLLTFSRNERDAEGGRGVDVHAVLDSVVALTAHALESRARLVKRYGAVPLVGGESSRYAQVFTNIVLNAVQALPEGFRVDHVVTVSTWTDEESGQAVVEIRDDGEGMDEAVLKRVFEPFFTTRPVGSGTGLGLSVAHGIVKAAGGRIEVESEPGHGTRVRVSLPPVPSPAKL
jgi:PAS domain S-box-containing protein